MHAWPPAPSRQMAELPGWQHLKLRFRQKFVAYDDGPVAVCSQVQQGPVAEVALGQQMQTGHRADRG